MSGRIRVVPLSSGPETVVKSTYLFANFWGEEDCNRPLALSSMIFPAKRHKRLLAGAQSIPDLVTSAKGPGGPLTTRPTIALREAIKAHSHVVQGSTL